MKRPRRPWGSRYSAAPILLLIVMAVAGGCSGPGSSFRPVRIEGIVTGKVEAPPRNDAPEGEKDAPRYFLWLKTTDGPALVEVSAEEFHSAADGESVCIACASRGR